MAQRDEKGKLLPGHPGLKKKGDVSQLAKDIKAALAEFINGKTDELENIWKDLKPKEKAETFVDLVPYLVPKQKEITVDFDESARKRMADLFPPELSDPEWDEKEALKEQLLQEHLKKLGTNSNEDKDIAL
jgi:hypothetical protein